MNSVLLRAAAPYILVIQLVLAAFFLLRGHNLPGGGFISGLLASASILLVAITFSVPRAKRAMVFTSRTYIGFGLMMVLISGLTGVAKNLPFMKGIWFGKFSLPGVSSVALGTPFLFDTGVFFVVLGMVTAVSLSLLETGE